MKKKIIHLNIFYGMVTKFQNSKIKKKWFEDFYVLQKIQIIHVQR